MTGQVYVHSASSDFADTDVVPRGDLGADAGSLAPVRWGHCHCCAPRPMRVRRSAWMRLVPFLRLYRCHSCDARVLRVRAWARRALGPVYMSAPPLRPETERLLSLIARLPLGGNAGAARMLGMARRAPPRIGRS